VRAGQTVAVSVSPRRARPRGPIVAVASLTTS